MEWRFGLGDERKRVSVFVQMGQLLAKAKLVRASSVRGTIPLAN